MANKWHTKFSNKKDQAKAITKIKRLIKVVEDIPSEEFDMTLWYSTNCKTVGCALGTVASNKWFNERGLHLKLFMKEKQSREYIPEYKGVTGYKAAAKFFQINRKDSNKCFDPFYYTSPFPTKYSVLQRLNSLLKYTQSDKARTIKPS